jgi:large subunit ribosomal protein L10
MNRTDKQTFVDNFREKVQAAPVLYLTDFSGLDVKSMTLLRQQLKASGAEYLVVKNRLVKLAVADLDMPDISEALLGPTGVVLGYEGVVEPAKVVSDFAKEHDDKPVFKLGVLDKKIVSAVEIQRLAKLPPRDQLLAELAGALEAPMAALVSALEGKVQEMAGLLDALREQKEGGGGEPPVAEEEAVQPDVKEEAAQPDAEAEEAQPDAEEEAAQPDAEAEAAQPDAEAEAAQPDAEAEEAQPDAEAEAAQPDAEEEEAQPDAEAEAAQPDAEAEEAQPDAEEEEAQPDAEEEAAQPDAEEEAESPDPEKEN